MVQWSADKESSDEEDEDTDGPADQACCFKDFFWVIALGSVAWTSLVGVYVGFLLRQPEIHIHIPPYVFDEVWGSTAVGAWNCRVHGCKVAGFQCGGVKSFTKTLGFARFRLWTERSRFEGLGVLGFSRRVQMFGYWGGEVAKRGDMGLLRFLNKTACRLFRF